ncbi:hypothetical protein FJT64_012968 [Amphibalanus amphitrite]|uniref:DUF7041 domain-containing protein n=1 Tax=Amphibalanus amphitrite TaxID=1232801 RepID=A0A6A4VAZ0_AMPAM|nr:hypothetical protein FJT64_012968 [Amphibalanus amphitrite]
MEAQFHIARITNDTTKFYHVLASLPPMTVSKLDGAVLVSHSYQALQQAVTELYERSKPELFDQLISKVQLTGRPSLYVRELQELAGKVGVGEELVRHKLLQSLPPAVGAVLAAQRDLSLQQLGKLADELMPLLQTSCLAAPQAQLSSHQRDQHRPPHRRGEQQQHQADYSALPTGLRPFHPDQRQQVCRAHLYFGAEARTCKPWCRWPKKTTNLQLEPSSRRASPERPGN